MSLKGSIDPGLAERGGAGEIFSGAAGALEALPGTFVPDTAEPFIRFSSST